MIWVKCPYPVGKITKIRLRKICNYNLSVRQRVINRHHAEIVISLRDAGRLRDAVRADLKFTSAIIDSSFKNSQ
jgi:hypothetical protein